MTEREEAFDDERYLFEPLVDGHRLLLVMKNDIVRLYTRHGYDITRQYPELHNVPLRNPAQLVLDGEVAFLDPETGKADFQILQKRFRLRKLPGIREAKKTYPLRFFVFDLIFYNDYDLRAWSLMERKCLAMKVLEENDYFKHLLFIEGEGRRMFDIAMQLGLEGIVCKAKESRYISGRSEDWVKVAAK
ncbi:hypothetical protein [Paenibacillus sp. HB172176]|uniref:ATP-dependent DNA ligase n=1 Tax=Paenibacillus sp. HB172176 TaxID=2493690 RepID=UPI00143A2BA0|nr:hypothetical protein [Paenibacillus sp. HB172176]